MDQALRTIVVGIGQTDELDPHLNPAVRIADAHGATLVVVHAYRLPDPLLYPYPEMGTFSPEVQQAAHAAVQARVESQVAQVRGSGAVEVRTVAGPADAAIVQVAEEVHADLVMVGATERGTLSRTVLGTTAGRVLRASPAPVLVNRRPDSKLIRRVLLTTDLSESSGRIFRGAVDLVQALATGDSVEMRVLLAVGDDLATPPPARMSVLQRIEANELRPFLERALGDDATVRTKVRVGDPARAILAEAAEWGADMVMVGSQGKGAVSRFLIGSVAESVVRHALCDVLVIPAKAGGG